MTYGPCAKARVFCEITTPAGERFVGENWCANPQAVCPRLPGEDYTKCTTVCQQEGHAEVVAVRLAGEKAGGATAILRGHTYACRPCQEAMFGAGVRFFGVEAPKTEQTECPQ